MKRYMDAQGGNWATIIAWNAFFAFFPMILITITIVGVILHDPGGSIRRWPPCIPASRATSSPRSSCPSG